MTAGTELTGIDLINEPVIETERIFNAPRALVWNVWTDPVHMAQWWGPHGFSNPVCKMDVRPGGLWHQTMESADGLRCPNVFQFDEVTPPERLVFRDVTDYSKGWEQHSELPHHAVHTVTFEEIDGKTKMRVITRLATLADRDAMIRKGFKGGFGQSLDRLAALVERLR